MEAPLNRRLGFTLIEMMIVLVIIALIASIVIPSMLRAKMAGYETDAIAACKTYATAQDIYRRTDWDQDGVLEYATAFKGDASLFEQVSGTGDAILIDAAFAKAEGDPGTATAKAGYVFLIQTGQGSHAPGGVRTYFQQGNMTAGYGLSTIPESYDVSGRNSFIINNMGTVYQRDRGVGSGTHELLFDPDPQWVPTK